MILKFLMEPICPIYSLAKSGVLLTVGFTITTTTITTTTIIFIIITIVIIELFKKIVLLHL